jgi:hypothetical protein
VGRPDEAERLMREAVALADRGPDRDRCIAGQFKGSFGTWLLDRKRFREAAPLLRQSLDETLAGCGSESFHLVEARDRVAALEKALVR